MSRPLESRLAAPAEFWAELRALYASPPRRYHTFDHVLEVLAWYDEVAGGPGWQRPGEVLCAVLFHDAVYRCGAPDNEARSADAARAAIARWLPSIDVDRVAALVELTARHGALTAGELDLDAALFVDCDMAILGAAPAEYAHYARLVAEEWAEVLPAAAFRAGRRAFLDRLLAREAIYLSDMFRQRLEARARANIAAEVAALAAAL